MNSNENLNTTEFTLLKMLWQMPYSSAWDLKGWPFLSASRVEANLNLLSAKGLIGYETMGWMLDAQRRYVLLDEGTDLVTERTGWRPTWFHSDAGRMHIRSRGPMVECFYDVAPLIWSPDWVEEKPNSSRVDDKDELNHLAYYYPEKYEEILLEIYSKPQPDSYTWLRQGPLHALVGMRRGHHLNPFWVPLIWFGTHAPKNLLPDTLNRLFDHLEAEPDPDSGVSARPPGVAIVAADELAAVRAMREMPQAVPRLAVVYGSYRGKKLRLGIRYVDPIEAWVPYGTGRVLRINDSIAPT